jgi:FkbM family methyltransferase
MRSLFEVLRLLLVTLTGCGYDRAEWMNRLHHKLAFRLHKSLSFFGIAGIQKISIPASFNREPDKSMYVRAEDGGVAHQLIMYRHYEPYESRLVREYLKPGMTVYNIGANLGYYVLLASEYIGERGIVYAFEPAPENFELLTRTIDENHIANAIALQTAVGATEGTAELSLSDTNSGDHQLREVSGRSHVTVNVTSIDNFISAGHSTPDAIILDVQGSELDVFLGAEALMSSPRPLILFTEFWPGGLNKRHPNGAAQFLDMLEGHGFTFQCIDEKHRKITRTTPEILLSTVIGDQEANLLCVRE